MPVPVERISMGTRLRSVLTLAVVVGLTGTAVAGIVGVVFAAFNVLLRHAAGSE